MCPCKIIKTLGTHRRSQPLFQIDTVGILWNTYTQGGHKAFTTMLRSCCEAFCIRVVFSLFSIVFGSKKTFLEPGPALNER